MSKPEPVRLRTDDCVVTVNGADYTPHEGEWVEVLIGQTPADFRVMRASAEMASRIAQLEGEDDEALRRIVTVDDGYADLIDAVRPRLVAWNWTDDLGQPLDQPRENPDVFNKLRIEEVLYLARAVKGDVGEVRTQPEAPAEV